MAGSCASEMSSTCMKRLARERERLPRDNKEFFINFKDDNLRSFEAYIVGPEDSLYRHKFIKLKFDIPSEYPLKPPKVTFIQHTGDRIHPNLYTEGKVCLSILGAWPGDPWMFSMTIESVLITVRSLLDNNPYFHEPKQRDNPAFNSYVQYNSWRWLLLDYLDREGDPDAQAFLQDYVREHGAEMVKELERQSLANNGTKVLSSPYKRGASQRPDFQKLLCELKRVVSQHSQTLTAQLAPDEALKPDERKRNAPDDAP